MFSATSAMVWTSRLTRTIRSKRNKLLWISAGGAAMAVILLSCSTTDHAILAPPNIPGAEFVGSEECATCHESITRDFATATHARLQAPGDNAKNMGCESCHGPGSLHVKSGGASGTIINPRRSPETCFQCHLEVRAKFELPHHHPVLEGKVSCADCHNPHDGTRHQRRRHQSSSIAQRRRYWVCSAKTRPASSVTRPNEDHLFSSTKRCAKAASAATRRTDRSISGC